VKRAKIIEVGHRWYTNHLIILRLRVQTPLLVLEEIAKNVKLASGSSKVGRAIDALS
jgi:hypothetical protein